MPCCVCPKDECPANCPFLDLFPSDNPYMKRDELVNLGFELGFIEHELREAKESGGGLDAQKEVIERMKHEHEASKKHPNARSCFKNAQPYVPDHTPGHVIDGHVKRVYEEAEFIFSRVYRELLAWDENFLNMKLEELEPNPRRLIGLQMLADLQGAGFDGLGVSHEISNIEQLRSARELIYLCNVGRGTILSTYYSVAEQRNILCQQDLQLNTVSTNELWLFLRQSMSAYAAFYLNRWLSKSSEELQTHTKKLVDKIIKKHKGIPLLDQAGSSRVNLSPAQSLSDDPL